MSNIDNQSFLEIKHLGDSLTSFVKKLTDMPLFNVVYDKFCPVNNSFEKMCNKSEFGFLLLQTDILRCHENTGVPSTFLVPTGYLYLYITFTYISNPIESLDQFRNYLSATETLIKIESDLQSRLLQTDSYEDSLLLAEICEAIDKELLPVYLNLMYSYVKLICMFDDPDSELPDEWLTFIPQRFYDIINQNLINDAEEYNNNCINSSSDEEFGKSQKGYVYILTNPSMPGLVKIGMTTNEPEQRVKELSAATGVPTPFDLIYYKEFNDCRAAEAEIHQKLSDKGYRYNTNREFFEMNTIEAINALMSIEDTIVIQHSEKRDNTKHYEAEQIYWEAWQYELGVNYPPGTGMHELDEDKAYELYKQAASLGSKRALVRIPGCVYKDVDKYLQESHESARKGASQCYMNIVHRTFQIYELNSDPRIPKSTKNNILQCLDLFVQKIETAYEVDMQSCLDAIKLYIYVCIALHKQVNENRLRPIIRKLKKNYIAEEEEYYTNMSDYLYYFHENDAFIEDQAEDVMKRLLGI